MVEGLDGPAEGTENRRVTLWDDEPAVMLVDGTSEAGRLAEAFEELGFDVVRAADTIAAESLFMSMTPSLIVLSLDDEGAAAFCDLIGAIPRGNGIPTILVGKDDAALRHSIKARLGSEHAFLERPIDRDDLLRQTARLMGLSTDTGENFSDSSETTNRQFLDTDQHADAPDIEGEETESPREPTLVLAEPTSAAEELLARGIGISLTDALGQASIDFDFDQPADQGPMPWEFGLGNSLDTDGTATGPSGLEPATDEKTNNGSPTGVDEPAPWSPSTNETDRPEHTQVLGDKGDEAVTSSSGDTDEATTDGVTALSVDFRRVIDEVAQRLFPEASLDEFEDEHFDNLHTVVPVVEQQARDYDVIDEYSLEAMETFTAGPGGVTFSGLDGAEVIEAGRASGDTHSVHTPATPTTPRSPPFGVAPPSALPMVQSPVPPAVVGAPPALLLEGRRCSAGELAEAPPAMLLAAAYHGRLDGQLVLRPSDENAPPDDGSVPRRTILFSGGHPVVATSGLVEDRLIEYLRRRGDLTAEVYREARERIDATGRRLGAVLVEMGTISSIELVPLVRWHFAELIHACFSWDKGTFWLEPLPALDQWRIQLEPAAPALLLESLRRRCRTSDLEERFGGTQAKLSPAPDLAELPLEGLLEGEDQLVALCDGTRNLGQVLLEAPVARGQALAVLWGLLLLERLYRGPKRIGEADDVRRDAARMRLIGRLRLCREADYFTLLGVPRDASSYEIRRAHEAALRDLSPGRLAAADAVDLADSVEELRFVINEAFEVLSENDLRDAYRRSRF